MICVAKKKKKERKKEWEEDEEPLSPPHTRREEDPPAKTTQTNPESSKHELNQSQQKMMQERKGRIISSLLFTCVYLCSRRRFYIWNRLQIVLHPHLVFLQRPISFTQLSPLSFISCWLPYRRERGTSTRTGQCCPTIYALRHWIGPRKCLA